MLDCAVGSSSFTHLNFGFMLSYKRTLFSTVCCLLLLAMLVKNTHAQTVGITSPTAGSTVNGVVLVEGTATDANFLRYELAFLQDANPGAGWIVFADGDQQVINGTLAIWDTTVGLNAGAPVFPDGTYQLRLRIVRADFNYDEYFTNNITINNSAPVTTESPTPIPTAVPPTATTQSQPPPNNTAVATQPATATVEPTATGTPTEIPTATPLPDRDVPTLIPTIPITLPPEQPGVLPSLTPFPTPTPQATLEGQNFNPIFREDEGEGADTASILDSVFGFDYSLFGEAFTTGVRFAFYIFAAFGVYLLIRTGVRWIWRTISSNW